jgi:amidohydrolase
MSQSGRSPELRKRIVDIRRRLHRIPESGFREHRTASLIAEHLRGLGLEVRTRVGTTGVVGVVRGQGRGPALMLRADMDGLPLAEDTGLSFASEHEGMMHACGHDGHMAMVLGAAEVLAGSSAELRGDVVFLFQPAEEGPGGASAMIREGVLEEYGVTYSLGCHLWPDIPEGCVGVREGAIMAALGRFDITVKGRGGHGAMPHKCVDAVDAGVQVVNGLQRLVSRQIDPLQPAVLTVGCFNAGTAFNVVAGEARLSGTTRTFDRDLQATWAGRIRRTVRGICESCGADFDLAFTPGFPPTVNDPAMVETVRRIAEDTLGPGRVLRPEPSMGAEDMSLFLERTSGCYFFLGVGREGCEGLHNPRFDFNEDVLLTGVELYNRLAMELVGPEGPGTKSRCARC